MRGPKGSSPRRWWASGRRGLADRRWTEVAVEVSQRGSVWSTENGSWGGIGCDGEMGCSWALYIGQGQLARVAEERSEWRPVEFHGAAVSSLESALRGGETGGGGGNVTKGEVEAARFRTRRRRLAGRQPAGRAVAARHRTTGGRQRRSGPSGLQRPSEPDDQVGQFQKWRTIMKMELSWPARDVWAEFKSGR
jgi:hypothetical protein